MIVFRTGRCFPDRSGRTHSFLKLANLHSDFMGGDDPDNEPEHRTAADAFDARLARCVDKENVRGDANDDAPSSSSSSSSLLSSR